MFSIPGFETVVNFFTGTGGDNAEQKDKSTKVGGVYVGPNNTRVYAEPVLKKTSSRQLSHSSNSSDDDSGEINSLEESEHEKFTEEDQKGILEEIVDVFNDRQSIIQWFSTGKIYSQDNSYSVLDIQKRLSNLHKNGTKSLHRRDKMYFCFQSPKMSVMEYSRHKVAVYRCEIHKLLETMEFRLENRIYNYEKFVNHTVEIAHLESISDSDNDDENSTKLKPDVLVHDDMAVSTHPINQEILSRFDELKKNPLVSLNKTYIGFIYGYSKEFSKHHLPQKEETKSESIPIQSDKNKDIHNDSKKNSLELNLKVFPPNNYKDDLYDRVILRVLIIKPLVLRTISNPDGNVDNTSWDDFLIIVKQGYGCIGFHIKKGSPSSSSTTSSNIHALNRVSINTVIEQLDQIGVIRHIYGDKLKEIEKGINILQQFNTSNSPQLINNLNSPPSSQSTSLQEGSHNSGTAENNANNIKNGEALQFSHDSWNINYSCILISSDLTNRYLKSHLWITQTLWREYNANLITPVINEVGQERTLSPENMCCKITGHLFESIARTEATTKSGKYISELDLKFLEKKTALFFKYNDSKQLISTLTDLINDEINRQTKPSKTTRHTGILHPIHDNFKTAKHGIEIDSNEWKDSVIGSLKDVIKANVKDSEITQVTTSLASSINQDTTSGILKFLNGASNHHADVFIPRIRNGSSDIFSTRIDKKKSYEGFSFIERKVTTADPTPISEVQRYGGTPARFYTYHSLVYETIEDILSL